MQRLCALLGLSSSAFGLQPAVVVGGRAALTQAQLQRLRDIQSGVVTKADVEVVLAQYEEDVRWSDRFAAVRTVYCKGSGRRAKNCVRLPNVGREGHTYLHHIVSNYERLSKWTVFSQAGEPTPGYHGHRNGGGHMLPGVSFDDYVLRDANASDVVDGAFFVFTGSLQLATLKHALRTRYVDAFFARTRGKPTRCPSKADPTAAAAGDGWEPLVEMTWFKEFLGSKCGLDPSDMSRYTLEYWRTHVSSRLPKSGLVFFAQGARFAVSRERIWQRPKSHYEELLREVSADVDPCVNYLNEWFWNYLIGAPQKPACEEKLEDPAPGSLASRTASRYLSSVSGCGVSGCGQWTSTTASPASSTLTSLHGMRNETSISTTTTTSSSAFAISSTSLRASSTTRRVFPAAPPLGRPGAVPATLQSTTTAASHEGIAVVGGAHRSGALYVLAICILSLHLTDTFFGTGQQ